MLFLRVMPYPSQPRSLQLMGWTLMHVFNNIDFFDQSQSGYSNAKLHPCNHDFLVHEPIEQTSGWLGRETANHRIGHLDPLISEFSFAVDDIFIFCVCVNISADTNSLMLCAHSERSTPRPPCYHPLILFSPRPCPSSHLKHPRPSQ